MFEPINKPRLIYSLLFFILLFDPFGEFHLKYPALIFIVIKAIQLNGNGIKRINIRNASVYIAILCYLITISILNDAFPRELFTILASLFVFSIFIILRLYKIFNDQLIFSMKLLIILNAMLLVIGFLNLEYALWINELLKPFKMISLETAFNYHVLYHNSIFFCIMGLPSIIASSRNKYSQILICFSSFLLIFKKSVIISIIAWLIFIIPSVVSRVIIILSIGLAAIYLVDMETLDGNRIRLGYLIRYLEIFSDPKILLFGEGLSISDWGNGFQANLIELTYFELIRYVGIPVSALFMVNLAWTTLHAISISKYRLQGLGVMMFLISCAFNPYLWGILGLPLIAIMIPVGDRVS